MCSSVANHEDHNMGDFVKDRAVIDLSTRLGRAPNASELATHMNMDREDVITMLLAGKHRPHIEPLRCARNALVLRSRELVEAYLAMHSPAESDRLRPLLAALPEQQLIVMLLRFHYSLNHTQIAAKTGLTQMEVSRLLASSLARLRDSG